MQVKIKGVEQDLLVSTVSVVPEDTGELHVLFCIHCTGFVVQYQGNIAKIVPLTEPYDRPLTINKCKKCATRYTFQYLPLYDTEYTHIVLERKENKNYNVFHCPRHEASRILVDYLDEEIHNRHGTAALPFSTSCPQCEHRYFFSDIV